eukprot:g22322.t1
MLRYLTSTISITIDSRTSLTLTISCLVPPPGPSLLFPYSWAAHAHLTALPFIKMAAVNSGLREAGDCLLLPPFRANRGTGSFACVFTASTERL